MKLDAVGARQDYLTHRYKKGLITVQEHNEEMDKLCRKVKELRKILKDMENR